MDHYRITIEVTDNLRNWIVTGSINGVDCRQCVIRYIPHGMRYERTLCANFDAESLVKSEWHDKVDATDYEGLAEEILELIRKNKKSSPADDYDRAMGVIGRSN